ncbi:phage tail assembly chaperone [Methylobacterium sp. 37f]|uniref:phage tail assembly chaperone n=1 Tax=Methylobacterium sp. 37f TaxID=2817058 RepID=UPI001FFC7B95|nr:hypothetical protein [Methylobacterium sp. 37f]MCK2056922.1 hypothetical protein [Methylobacterium sp. 37f]
MASEKKIGGVVYRCDKLPAEQALKLYMRLNQVFKGDQVVLGTIAANVDREGALQAFLHASMNQVLDSDDVVALITEAVGLCRVGNDPAILGVKPNTMDDAVEVAWFAFGVQFRDFIIAGLGKMAEA